MAAPVEAESLVEEKCESQNHRLFPPPTNYCSRYIFQLLKTLTSIKKSGYEAEIFSKTHTVDNKFLSFATQLYSLSRDADLPSFYIQKQLPKKHNQEKSHTENDTCSSENGENMLDTIIKKAQTVQKLCVKERQKWYEEADVPAASARLPPATARGCTHSDLHHCPPPPPLHRTRLHAASSSGATDGQRLLRREINSLTELTRKASLGAAAAEPAPPCGATSVAAGAPSQRLPRVPTVRGSTSGAANRFRMYAGTDAAGKNPARNKNNNNNNKLYASRPSTGGGRSGGTARTTSLAKPAFASTSRTTKKPGAGGAATSKFRRKRPRKRGDSGAGSVVFTFDAEKDEPRLSLVSRLQGRHLAREDRAADQRRKAAEEAAEAAEEVEVEAACLRWYWRRPKEGGEERGAARRPELPSTSTLAERKEYLSAAYEDNQLLRRQLKLLTRDEDLPETSFFLQRLSEEKSSQRCANTEVKKAYQEVQLLSKALNEKEQEIHAIAEASKATERERKWTSLEYSSLEELLQYNKTYHVAEWMKLELSLLDHSESLFQPLATLCVDDARMTPVPIGRLQKPESAKLRLVHACARKPRKRQGDPASEAAHQVSDSKASD